MKPFRYPSSLYSDRSTRRSMTPVDTCTYFGTVTAYLPRTAEVNSRVSGGHMGSGYAWLPSMVAAAAAEHCEACLYDLLRRAASPCGQRVSSCRHPRRRATRLPPRPPCSSAHSPPPPSTDPPSAEPPPPLNPRTTGQTF